MFISIVGSSAMVLLLNVTVAANVNSIAPSIHSSCGPYHNVITSQYAGRSTCNNNYYYRSRNSNERLFTRARVVTANHLPTPDYVLQSEPLTRTPYDVVRGSAHGPAWYGAPMGGYAVSYVWRGSILVPFDPYASLNKYELDDIRIARNLWLIEKGYVEQARIVRKADSVINENSSNNNTIHSSAYGELPQPRATIEINKKPEKNNRLQVSYPEPGKVVITSDNSIAESTNLASVQVYK